MSPKSIKPRPISEVLSQIDTALSINPIHPSTTDGVSTARQGGVLDQSEGTIISDPALSNQLKERRESAGTTNSSPTDPAYMPTRQVHIRDSIVAFDNGTHQPQQPNVMEEYSFFESDTEYSDDESPVIGRASSVRTASPRVVAYTPTALERRGTFHGQHSAPRALRSPTTTVGSVAKKIDGTTSTSTPQEVSRVSDVSSETLLPYSMSPTTIKKMSGGLRSHPITQSDTIEVHLTNTTSTPKENNRKVRIRPSDLITAHDKNSSRFRESIVSTPYPTGTKSDEPYSRDEKKYSTKDISPTAFPGSLRSHRSPRNSDRFPSPHHPEVLFIDLSLARHATIVATLEIRITDKDRFDDEMLFRQLRTTYHQRMLGWPRLPFRLIRIISDVTMATKSIDNTPFNTADFIRHFCNPRIGNKRKTWTIWLRNHNRQPSPISPRQDTDHFKVQKRPLTPLPAEKRLSMHSDSSSSIVNFSILPPLSVARIPFFRDRVHKAQSHVQSEVRDVEKQQQFGLPTPNSSIRIDTSVSSTTTQHPMLVLHHTFSALPLLLFFFLSILSAITATTLWVIFGVPGNRPGQETENVVNLAGGTAGGGIQWGFSAQGRVLTGLVLGLVVLVVGWVGEAVMILGGWVLM